MEVMPGYKQTEVGVIPEDWEVVSIGNAGQVLGGRQRSPHNVGEPCKYLRVANVFDGFLETEDVLEMPFTTAEKERFLLRHGDILLNEGQSIDLVGRSAIYRGIPDQCCFQNTLIRFRANRNTCVEFAQLVFQQYLRLGVFASIALQTTSIAHLGSGRFAVLKMPLPPLPEQKAIAKVLGNADALIETLEQLIAKKRILKQGAMQKLLTGKKRLPGFIKEWETRYLADVAPLQRGFDLPNSKLQQGPYPVVYSNGVLNHHAAFQVKGPGIVTGRSGTIGTVTFVEQDFWPHNTSLWVTTFKDNDPKFIFYLYARIGLERFATGTGVPTLNRNDVHSFKVRIPPTKAEQEAIAAILSTMDAEIALLEAQLAKYRQLKQGLMQKLLTGRIRLV